MPSDNRDEIVRIAARRVFLEKSGPYLRDRIGRLHERNYFNTCGILFEIVQYDLSIFDGMIIDFRSFPLFIRNSLSVLGVYAVFDTFFGNLCCIRNLDEDQSEVEKKRNDDP